MVDAKALCTRWQALVNRFSDTFTRPGWIRFHQWLTGTVLCWEKHTITQILTSIKLQDQWRNLEHFAEYGAFDRGAVEVATIRLVEAEKPARFAGFHPVALDDTKEHRTSKNVWGTCTFFEPAGRSPNRASTVRAHNWIELGDLLPGEPWRYLPHTARLYFRKSQLPAGETFCTKTAWAVDMLRQVDANSAAPILAAFDGAYANRTVIGPCINPGAGQRRIEVVTRLREDARLFGAKEVPQKRSRGRPRKHGPRLPPPRDHLLWNVAWRKSTAYVYGRERTIRYKKMECYWSVAGPEQKVHVFVFEVEGYSETWYTVTTALSLTPEETVSVFAARFRQENGFRDHKQRLGMEECRAWTKEPVLRTFGVQMVAQTLLTLMQFQLDEAHGEQGWWSPPDWNRRKEHPSLLDVRRLFWECREEFSQLLREPGEMHKILNAADAKRTG